MRVHFVNMRLRAYILCLLMCLLCGYTQAAPPNYLQKPLTTTMGSEYWLAFMKNKATLITDQSLKFVVIVTAAEAAEISIESPLGAVYGTISIPDGGGYGEFSNFAAQDVYMDESEVIQRRGIYIHSDKNVPFSCFAYIDAGTEGVTSRDATLLLPLTKLEREYVIQTYPEDSYSTEFAVVATEDNTCVTVVPHSKTYKGSEGGTPLNRTLKRGEVFMVASIAYNDAQGAIIDMSGSTICADKPVAVFTGNEATKIPVNQAYSEDHTFEQVQPVKGLGTEFYIGLGASAKDNRFYITATQDGTEVTVKRGGTTNNSTVYQLDAFQSITLNNKPVSVQLNPMLSNAYISSNKPILVFDYLSCGAQNQEQDVDPVTGDMLIMNWGNPANAQIPSWSNRVKDMTFFTRKMPNENETVVQKNYVQVVTLASQTSLISLDGDPVSATWTTFAHDNSKAYANILLPDTSYHRLQTTGDGFVGFVYGINSDAQAYMYTLGYTPTLGTDSLFITTQGNVMSSSYDLDRLDQGWYQRQLYDFEDPTKAAPDTAIFCDGATVDFLTQLSASENTSKLSWQLFECDKEGHPKETPVEPTPVDVTDLSSHNQTWQHTFELEEQADLPPEQRDPFCLYQLDVLLTRDPLICKTSDCQVEVIDTLRTMIRVNRIYNDTTWRVICQSDTLHFFYDDYNHAGDTALSIFKYETNDPQHDTLALHLGINTFRREYLSLQGCDSISTLMVMVCDTFVRTVDTVVCERGLPQLKKAFPGRFDKVTFLKKNERLLYSDTIKVSCLDECMEDTCLMFKKYCPNYTRCDSILNLYLTVKTQTRVDTTDYWCTLGDTLATYLWYDRAGNLIEEISQKDKRFNKQTGRGVFNDTIKYSVCEDCPEGGCDSMLYRLTLTVVSNENRSFTKHICQNQEYVYAPFAKRYYGRLLPIGETVEYKEIMVRDEDGNVKCSYWDTLHLFVHRIYTDTTEMTLRRDTVCESTEYYSWTGHTANNHMVWDHQGDSLVRADRIPRTLPNGVHSRVYVYTDSLLTTTCQECITGFSTGCDSIWTLRLLVGAEEHYNDPLTMCDNRYVVWQDTLFYGYKCDVADLPAQPANRKLVTGDYYTSRKDTVTMYGCDSTRTLQLTIYPTHVAEPMDTNVCVGQRYLFDDGRTYVWNTVKDTVLSYIRNSSCGCDSGVIHHVYVHPVYNLQDTPDTVCRVIYGRYQWTNHTESDSLWVIRPNGQKMHLPMDSIPLSVAGTFTLIDSLKTRTCATCHNGFGCDSVRTMLLTIIPTYDDTVSYTMSEEQIYEWEGVLYYGKRATIPSGTTLPTQLVEGEDFFSRHYYTAYNVGTHTDQCDSLLTLHMRVGDVFRDTTYDAVCANCGSYLWVITSPITGQDTTITITDLPLAGETRAYYDSLYTSLRFDSIYVRYLTGYANHNLSMRDTVCLNAGYIWEGHESVTLSTNRVGIVSAVDSLLTDNLYTNPKTGAVKHMRCDSVWTIDLLVLPTSDDTLRHMMSDEDTVHWEGRILAGELAVFDNPDQLQVVRYPAGVNYVTDSLLKEPVGRFSCDSVRTLKLLIGKVFRDTTYDYVCENCDYIWTITSPITGQDTVIPIPNSAIPAAPGVLEYKNELRTALDFDSVYTLILTSYPAKSQLMYDTICQGQYYEWLGHTGYSVLPQDTGWITMVDSLHTDTLYYNPKKAQPDVVHCDSVWTLRLYVQPTYNGTYNKQQTEMSTCSNDTLTWSKRLYVGYDFDEQAHPIAPVSDATPYKDIRHYTRSEIIDGYLLDSAVGRSQGGCDSIHYFRLYVSESRFTFRIDSIGDNDSTWHFGGGSQYPDELTGRIFWTDDYGHPVDYTQPRNERRYFFIDTLRTATGCDSIVHDSVYVFPTWRFTQKASTCSNRYFEWRNQGGLNYLGTGYYYDSVYTHYIGTHRFDSVYVLYLRVLPGAYHEAATALCKNDTVMWETMQVYWHPGWEDSYTFTYETGDGCDSIIKLIPTFYEYYHFDADIDSVCQGDSYRWYAADGSEHTQALYDEQGNRLGAIPTDTVGWITVYDSLHTSSACHCDSTFTLRLFVRPTYYFHDTAYVLCTTDTLHWHGKEYTTSVAKVIEDVEYNTTMYGCDSTYYLRVRFNQAYSFRETDTLCSDELTYNWHGQSLDEAMTRVSETLMPIDTVLVDSASTVAGCDSVFTLTVTIQPILTHEWTDTICVGETYHLNNKTFTEPGICRDTTINDWGCYYYEIVHLDVLRPTVFHVEIDTACGDDADWTLHYTYDEGGYEPFAFTLRYDSAAEAQNFVSLYNQTVTGSSITLPLPAPMPGKRFVRPDYYRASLFFDNGTCQDSVTQQLNIVIPVRYPSWIMEQHWLDAIGILSYDYNDGYDFTAFQWYRNDTLMPGETKPYYYYPQYLTVGAEYTVALTREGEDYAVLTCPLIPDMSGQQSLTPTMPYVSVVPTLVVREHPVVNILCVNPGNYELYDTYGALYRSGRFIPGAHNAFELTLPSVPGVYVFHLADDSGVTRTVKVLVQ